MAHPVSQLLSATRGGLSLIWLLASVHLSLADDAADRYEFVQAAVNGQEVEVVASLGRGISIDSPTEGFTALMGASGAGQRDMVKLLLNRGAAVNIQGKHKETALLLASVYGRKDIIELLLAHGADFRVSDTGLTPLMMAASQGHTDVVNLLLSKGEKVNAKQPDGWTVLMHAAVKGEFETISSLLAHKADVTPKNDDGKTAADIAKEYHHPKIEEMLRSKGTK